MANQAPTCKKCGAQHWGFVLCAEVEGWRDRRDEAAKRQAPHTVRQPRYDRDGNEMREWGDRFLTVERRGTSLLQPRSVPLETGRLVYPEGTDGPQK